MWAGSGLYKLKNKSWVFYKSITHSWDAKHKVQNVQQCKLLHGKAQNQQASNSIPAQCHVKYCLLLLVIFKVNIQYTCFVHLSIIKETYYIATMHYAVRKEKSMKTAPYQQELFSLVILVFAFNLSKILCSKNKSHFLSFSIG